MTAALKIPENYAEELPKTISELKAQQEYFNQLENAAKKIQEATENYNKLLEQWLTAIPANNTDYTWEQQENSENTQKIKNNYSEDNQEINEYNQNKEIEIQDSEEIPEETSEEEEQTETNEYPQSNNDEVEENTKEETQTQWPKINLNSLLNKNDNEK